MNLERIVDVQIALNTAGISKNGFSTILVGSYHPAVPYQVTTITDIDQMSDYGFIKGDGTYDVISDIFSQIPHPTTVKLARLHGTKSTLTFNPHGTPNENFVLTVFCYDENGNRRELKKVIADSTGSTSKTELAKALATATAVPQGVITSSVTPIGTNGQLIKYDDDNTFKIVQDGENCSIELAGNVGFEVSLNIAENAEYNVPISQAMANVFAFDSDFYGVVLDYKSQKTKQLVKDMEDYCESKSLIFGYDTTDMSLLTETYNNNYMRSFGFFLTGEGEPAAAATMSRCFSIEPGGETWALKTLAGIVPSPISETQHTLLQQKNANSYERVRNISVTQNGKVGGGEWIDVIRFRDWLVEEIKTNVFTLLKNSDKVPYTDAGIAMIEGVVRKALEDGVTRGGIAPEEYDSNGNKNPSYTLTVPLAADITALDKSSRVLKDIKFTARLAGAIHVVEIKGSFTYDNLISTNNGINA